MKTLDRTPVCNDAPPHKRRKGGRAKPFKIERRYIGNRGDGFMAMFFDQYREWRSYRGYETDRSCDEALRVLQKNQYTSLQWEYRKCSS